MGEMGISWLLLVEMAEELRRLWMQPTMQLYWLLSFKRQPTERVALGSADQ
jgi:hypothetical protein